MDVKATYKEVSLKDSIPFLIAGEAYICQVYKKLDGGKSFYYQYLSHFLGQFHGLKEDEEVVSVLIQLEQDRFDELEIEQMAKDAYPEKRLTEIGLQFNEIANLRVGFIKGFRTKNNFLINGK